MRVAGLILAGGDSRRMGRPKQLLRVGGQTLVERAVRLAEEVWDLDPLVLVLPPDPSLVPDPPVTRTVIVRRRDEGGCSRSLHAALRALPDTIAAIAVWPADQIHLTPDLLRQAVKAWTANLPVAQVMAYRDGIGHPFVFDAGLRPQLLALHGDKGMWRVLDELGDRMAQVSVDRERPQDIDTWDDYVRVVRTYQVFDPGSGATEPSSFSPDRMG